MPLEAEQLSLADRLRAACSEGIESNVLRFLSFRGTTAQEPIEMQALDVPSRGQYHESRFAHASSAEAICRLLSEADRWHAPGVYFLFNEIDPAVATRAQQGRWHGAKKGQSTSDANILTRRALFVDVDVQRPPSTSATDAQVKSALDMAECIGSRLATVLSGYGAIGFGHSGNGASIMLALNRLPENAELAATIKGILAALGALFSTPQLAIDGSVCDAKRLCPAWGTVKRKGAVGIADRPHRKTGFLCERDVAPLEQADLSRLLEQLERQLDDSQRQAVDKAMGRKIKPVQSRPAHVTQISPFTHANAVDIADVAQRLGLVEGEYVRCPGCNTVGDSSVAIVGNGIKCLHARCAQKGSPGKGGYRTPIDLVCEVNSIDAKEAVKLLGEWFGFETWPDRQERRNQTQPSEDYVESETRAGIVDDQSPHKARERYDVRSVRQVLTGVFNRAQAPKPERSGAVCGHHEIDYALGTFRRGRVTVLGAGTSWGKSSFAVMTFDESQKIGKRVLIVSGEDPEDSYGQRLMSRRADIRSIALRDGDLSADEFGRMVDTVQRASSDIFFLNGIGKTAEQLAAAIRAICVQDNPDLVIVDYIQAFSCSKRCQDKRNEVTHIARTFVDAIKVGNASGLVFSQLKRPDGQQRPTMHDLKESGDIENMAEHVLIGFSTKSQNSDCAERRIVVEKNKDGPKPRGAIKMPFDERRACFVTP